MARLLAPSHLYYLLAICVGQLQVNLLKLSDLFPAFADSSVLLTPLVPRESAADSFRKFLFDALGEDVGGVFLARSPFKVQLPVLRQSYVVVVSRLI